MSGSSLTYLSFFRAGVVATDQGTFEPRLKHRSDQATVRWSRGRDSNGNPPRITGALGSLIPFPIRVSSVARRPRGAECDGAAVRSVAGPAIHRRQAGVAVGGDAVGDRLLERRDLRRVRLVVADVLLELAAELGD